MTGLPINAPSPRLCHITKWPDFDGYGFNLHADKSRPGQYIGKVDDDSPADLAGLKEGDRIIEVNGVNISNENHKQVVQRIKAVSNETQLLVVDSESDRWYKSHNLVVKGDQSNIIYGSSKQSSSPESPPESLESPPPSIESPVPEIKTKLIADEDNKSIGSSSSSLSENSTQPQQEDDAKDNEITDKEPIASLTLEDSTPMNGDDNSEKNDNSKKDNCSDKRDCSDKDDCSEKDYDDSSEKNDSSEKEDLYSVPIRKESSPEVSTESDPSAEYDNVRFEYEENVQNDKKSAESLRSSEDRQSLSSRSSSASCSGNKADTENVEDGSLPDTDHEERKSPMSTTPSPPPSINPEGTGSNNRLSSQNSSATPTPTPITKTSSLNLNMTAAEMRAYLATKKKFDPRKDTIDLKKKYQIVQNM